MWITRLACPNTYLGTLALRLDKQAGLPSTPCVCSAAINKGSVQRYRVEICCSYRTWDVLLYFCRQLHACSDSAEELLITAETFLACCIKALQQLYTHLKLRDTYIRDLLEYALCKWGELTEKVSSCKQAPCTWWLNLEQCGSSLRMRETFTAYFEYQTLSLVWKVILAGTHKSWIQKGLFCK